MHKLLFLSLLMATGGEALTRDEVAGLKRKLLAVAAALGQPPTGYVKEQEAFDLPTASYLQKTKDPGKSDRRDWVSPSMTARFTGGERRIEEKSQDQLKKESEKKIAEAMAKGDYQAIGKITEEIQRQAGRTQLAVAEARKDPIALRIGLNALEGQTVDPDAVVFEKAGVIALLVDTEEEKASRLLVLFDPVALKETKTLSRVDLRQPDGGVSRKTAVYNARVELTGPAAEIKSWARRMNTGTALGQIDSGR